MTFLFQKFTNFPLRFGWVPRFLLSRPIHAAMPRGGLWIWWSGNFIWYPRMTHPILLLFFWRSSIFIYWNPGIILKSIHHILTSLFLSLDLGTAWENRLFIGATIILFTMLWLIHTLFSFRFVSLFSWSFILLGIWARDDILFGDPILFLIILWTLLLMVLQFDVFQKGLRIKDSSRH